MSEAYPHGPFGKQFNPEPESSNEPLAFLDYLKFEHIDPKKDLVGRDCSGWNFQNADVTDWDFTNADLRGANLSGVQNIGMALWDNTKLEGTTLPEDVQPDDLESPRQY